MPLRGLVEVRLPDPAWGNPRLVRIVPSSDSSWGKYLFLVGTGWEPLIPEIPAEILDQALRGHATPLMRVLGPPPAALARRLPPEESVCALKGQCTAWTPGCVPGPRVPLCWEPPGELPLGLMGPLVAFWRQGVPVVRIGG